MLNFFIKIFFVCVFSFNLAIAKPITIGTEVAENPPYVIGSGTEISDESPGIYIELMRQVAKNLKIEFEFVRRPWKRILVESQLGKIDAVLGSSFKQERSIYNIYPTLDGQIDPARGIGLRSYSLYQKNHQPRLWDGKEFTKSNQSIGVMRGYAIVSMLENKGLNLVEVATPIQLLAMLQADRLDGLIDLDNYIDNLLLKHPELAKDVIKITPPIRRKSYYVMFSKKFAQENLSIIHKIWNEIGKVTKSEFYSKMLQTYAAPRS